MIVAISYTVDVSDDYRRAIRSYYGQGGMATREEVREWFRQHGRMMDDDVMYDYTQKLDYAQKGKP